MAYFQAKSHVQGAERNRTAVCFRGIDSVSFSPRERAAFDQLMTAAVVLCNAHGWSFGGPETLYALAEDVAQKAREVNA